MSNITGYSNLCRSPGLNVPKSSSPNVPKSPGLPGEEYAALVRKRKLERLYKDHAERAYQRNKRQGPYQDIPRPSQSRPKIQLPKSQVATATRKALGPSFYPREYLSDDDSTEDEGYAQPKLHSTWKQKEERQGHIPQKYIDQFNRKWHEHDEDDNASQYLADINPSAPWRVHAPLRPMYGPNGEWTTSDNVQDWAATQSSMCGPRPELPQSKFSFSTRESSTTEEKRSPSPGKRLRKGFTRSLSRLCDKA